MVVPSGKVTGCFGLGFTGAPQAHGQAGSGGGCGGASGNFTDGDRLAGCGPSDLSSIGGGRLIRFSCGALI